MPGKIKCVAGTSGQILIDIGKPCASARQIDSVLCDLRRDLRRDPLQEGFHFRCELVDAVHDPYIDRLRRNDLFPGQSGNTVDTDHFNSKTGIRTFEAAAFLRKSGADAVRVRKMFREDIEDYRVSADSIAGAEVFMDHFAISECTGKTNESLNVVAAQTANSLLNINGIKAKCDTVREANDSI